MAITVDVIFYLYKKYQIEYKTLSMAGR